MTRILRFGKYNLVGWMGAMLQLLLISILTKQFNITPVVATPIAVEMAVLHNFLWHERFTWRGREPGGALARMGRFQAANGLISLIGNTLLMYGLAGWLKLPVVPSAMGAIVLCSLANFLIADRWVYAST